VLVGRGETVVRALWPDWTERWAWNGGDVVERGMAAIARPEGGVWLADSSRIVALSTDGIVEDVLDPGDDDSHLIVALAVLSDGALCSGGDRAGA
jgi:hypothetical protein